MKGILIRHLFQHLIITNLKIIKTGGGGFKIELFSFRNREKIVFHFFSFVNCQGVHVVHSGFFFKHNPFFFLSMESGGTIRWHSG